MPTKTTKVLITVPELSRPGGVTALYNILELDQSPNIDYYVLHSGNKAVGKINRLLELVYTYIKFIKRIRQYQILHTNPSLSPKSYYRDALFVWLSLKLGKKVLVYWHGWDDNFAAKIPYSWFLKTIFNKTYAKANISIVLGTVFKTKLLELGIKNGQNIFIESNAASDKFISKNGVEKKRADNEVVFLFLARIEREKGIYIAVDTINELAKNTNVKLIIAGDGSELPQVKKYVQDKKINNVVFTGYVGGLEKHEALAQSDIFIFPTYHKEGMPISVIEAMLYGLPVITTTVGGIPDWLIDNENGFLIEKADCEEFVKKAEMLLNDRNRLVEISSKNREKANLLFTPAQVKKRIYSYYQTIISDFHE